MLSLVVHYLRLGSLDTRLTVSRFSLSGSTSAYLFVKEEKASSLRLAACFVEQQIHGFLPVAEVRAFQPLESVCEIENPVLCSTGRQPHGSGDDQASLKRN